jgi:hypothetical protein
VIPMPNTIGRMTLSVIRVFSWAGMVACPFP